MRKATALLIGGLVSVASLRVVLAQQSAAADDPAFEVATLKSVLPFVGFGLEWGRNTWSTGTPLRLGNLLATAYGTDKITGLPEWNDDEQYAVNAKAEDGVLLTREALAPRLRHLLVERFNLKTHIETTYADGLALIVAQGGPKPKLKASDKPLAMTAIADNRVHAPAVTMDVFAKILGNAMLLHQPVANDTGLTGTFEFTLEFAPEYAVNSPLPSLSTALQDELGLKLENGHKVPVTTLVIDRVEKPKTD